MQKVKSYAKSNEGKRRMDEYIGQCVSDGRNKTAGGSQIITVDIMNRAANAMINKLKEVAGSKSLPESVVGHFNSLTATEPMLYDNGKQYKVDISFGDNLSRLSFQIAYGKKKGQYTGDGIDNIVSLFDTGMDADRMAYGLWIGYEVLGPVAGLTHRDELRFMSEAVSEFNLEYGDLYNVYAYISADPDFYAR
jgi:hypothetical protein